jgi:hypothetical protein
MGGIKRRVGERATVSPFLEVIVHKHCKYTALPQPSQKNPVRRRRRRPGKKNIGY